MKKSTCFLLTVSLLLCFCFPAAADAMDLSRINTKDTFFYNDSGNTAWTYYQSAEKGLADGSNVEFMLVVWGDGAEATSYPEFRVFASTKADGDLVVQDATFMIDGNLFELTFKALSLDNYTGVYANMTNEALPFLQSLAAAKTLSAVLRYEGGVLSVPADEEMIASIGQFAYDALSMDLLHHVTASEARNESLRAEQTPVVSYVFNPVDWTGAGEGQAPSQAAGEEWTAHFLDELGLEISLPADFQVYTRGMSADDPTVRNSGYTPAQIDQLLISGGYYLEATGDDFNSEVIITMLETTVGNMSSLSDSLMLSLASVMTDSLKQMGAELLEDASVFSHNGVKYIRLCYKQLYDGNILYKIQYHTVVNRLGINFLYLSHGDEITEAESAFMQSVVERVVFGAGASSTGSAADSALREYTLPAGPFTVALDDTKYTVLLPDMPANDPAVLRSGIPAAGFEEYMSLVDKALLMFDINDRMPAASTVSIRIKDQKYTGIDLRKYSPEDVDIFLNLLYSGFQSTSSDKEIVTVNGVPYLKFLFMNSSQLRYATVINGDMIYIWAAREEGTITDGDAALLRQVVESIQYPD